MALSRRLLSFGTEVNTFTLRFLGISGGLGSRPYSSGNGQSLGGGGAGEYLEKTVLPGEISQSYQVIIGAGNGGDTTFQTNGSQANTFDFILSGNSGYGANAYVFDGGRTPGPATLNESAEGSLGNSGGNYSNPPGFFASGGGGGAGTAGEDSALRDPGNGGAGVSSDITGSAVIRGGGGGGAVWWTDDAYGAMSTAQINSSGLGGAGGGGRGGVTDADEESGEDYMVRTNTNGSTNTGGGGGGRSALNSASNGGSGVVILRYPNTLTITVGAGLTSTTTTTGTDKVTTFTAGSDNISFA
jgi:hypothetical protein